jgi:hypothetical protein
MNKIAYDHYSESLIKILAYQRKTPILAIGNSILIFRYTKERVGLRVVVYDAFWREHLSSTDDSRREGSATVRGHHYARNFTVLLTNKKKSLSLCFAF